MTDRPIKVMLVDDDDDDYVILQRLTSEVSLIEIQLDRVATYDAALEAIQEDNHDVYLVDYRLGERSGLDLMKEAVEGGCTRPLLVLTGKGNRDVDATAERLGAAGYLDKEKIDAVLLERSIRYALRAKPPPLAGPPARPVPRPGDLQLQIALARGTTVRDAAKAAGIGERTAYRRVRDPDFMAEVEELREELRLKVVDQVANQLSGQHFAHPSHEPTED